MTITNNKTVIEVHINMHNSAMVVINIHYYKYDSASKLQQRATHGNQTAQRKRILGMYVPQWLYYIANEADAVEYLLADWLQKEHMMRIIVVRHSFSQTWQQFSNISDTRRNARQFTHQTQATANIIQTCMQAPLCIKHIWHHTNIITYYIVSFKHKSTSGRNWCTAEKDT